jgi:hypothetical protein
VGSYEDLIRDTVDAVLEPDVPVRIDQLARLVWLRASVVSTDVSERPLDLLLLETVLRDDPRFVEVAPGVWSRRHDGPEAGVPSRPRRPPLAGSAAAAAVPPEPHLDVDAVAGGDARATSGMT